MIELRAVELQFQCSVAYAVPQRHLSLVVEYEFWTNSAMVWERRPSVLYFSLTVTQVNWRTQKLVSRARVSSTEVH